MKLAAERGGAALISPSEGRRGLRAGATRTSKSRACAGIPSVRRNVIELKIRGYKRADLRVSEAAAEEKAYRGACASRSKIESRR